MTEIFLIFLSILIVGAAVLAITMKSVVSAVITSGIVSLLASIVYLILAAPDVAMTEAAIGSALTTMVFLYALNKVRKEKENSHD